MMRSVFVIGLVVALLLDIMPFPVPAGTVAAEAPLPTVASAPATTTRSATRPPQLSSEAWASMRASIEQAHYWFTSQRALGQGYEQDTASAYQAPNRVQQFHSRFSAQGARFAPSGTTQGAWDLGLTLTGYGVPGALQAPPSAYPQANANRIEYQRGNLIEWYINTDQGVEQGFTLLEPPPGAHHPTVVLQMVLQGDLTPTLVDQGRAIVFAQAGGVPVLRYHGLIALDATGRKLPATMSLTTPSAGHPPHLQLTVDTTAAHYPIIVDPLLSNEIKLFATEAVAEDHFSWSVAVSDRLALVGSPLDNEKGIDAGAAYVFIRTNGIWTLEQKLGVNDLAAGDQFGSSVAIDGDLLVVGAPWHDQSGTNAGAAYVFMRSDDNWTVEQKLTLETNTGASDRFGWSVAIEGGTIVVGSPFDDDQGPDTGSATVFTRTNNTWGLQQTLTISDTSPGAHFGWSVDIAGDTVVVGTPLDDEAGTDAGAAYIWQWAGTLWTPQTKIIATDTQPEDHLGWSVAIAENSVAIGAPQHDTPTPNAGAAYIWTATDTLWSEEAKLTAEVSAQANAHFGWSVDISGGTVVVGAPNDDTRSVDAGAAYVMVRGAPGWRLQQQLLPSDLEIGNNFGWAVATDLDLTVVGSPLDDDGGVDAGVLYIWLRSNNAWTIQQRMTASEANFTFFGWSMDVDGPIAVIGAYGDDDGGSAAGAAYVFVQDGPVWKLRQKLRAADGGVGDEFGWSVDVSGTTIVVSARYDNAAGNAAGAAYIFTYDGVRWNQHQKLQAPDGAAGDYFGYDVSLDGDTVVVGAPYHDAAGLDTGAAYIFARTGITWTQQHKLIATTPSESAYFGWSVSLKGDTVAVGALLDDSAITDGGAVYIWTRSGTLWSPQVRLTASDATIGDFLGNDVALSGNTLLVGAYSNNQRAMNAGAAYVFVQTNQGWVQQTKLVASDGRRDDAFGWSVALVGNMALIGSRYNDERAPDAGAVYVWNRTGTVWNQSQKIIATDSVESDYFGSAIALGEEVALIGAYGDDDGGTNAGASYLYTVSGIVYVDDDFTPSTPGWSVNRFASIQAGIAAVAPGETQVRVAPGHYTESVVLTKTTTVLMTGDIQLDGAVSLVTGALLAPSGTLTMTGDFTRTGGLFDPKGGTLAFASAPEAQAHSPSLSMPATQTLNLALPTTFSTVIVGPNTILVEAPGPDYATIGTLINQGTLRKTQPVTAANLSFGLTGVQVQAASAGATPATIQVDRIDQDAPGVGSMPGLQTGRHWYIQTISNSHPMSVSLPHLAVGFPKACISNSTSPTGWDCAADRFDGAFVTRAVASGPSLWTVGADVGPNLVGLRQLSAHSPLPHHPVLGLLLLGLVGLLLPKIWWGYRKTYDGASTTKI